MTGLARRIGAWIARHRTGVLAGALTALFVLLAGTAFAVGFVTAPTAEARPTAPPSASATPTVRPTPIGAVGPSRLRTCSVAEAAADPRLRTLGAQVVNAATGEVLFDRTGTTARSAGGLVKILTASAAVAVLGPDFRIATDVVDTESGGIAIIGRGDATLSQTPAGTESWYRGAPKLSDLAGQTIQRWTAAHPGQPITSLTLDASYWTSADTWDPTWPESERTGGWQSQVTALQVDGDRENPVLERSPRSTDPVARAGALFVAALRAADPGGVVAADLAVTTAAAPAGSAPLAQVQSQPVSVLVPQMLAQDDDTLGEMLARIVSVQAGGGGTAASLGTVVPKALAQYGIATDGIAIRDGSGESSADAVPPAYLAALMAKIDEGAQNLDILRDGLPVAGQPGGLESRFTGADAKVRGQVTAQAGSLPGVSSLAGIVDARDGTKLAFAFSATGDGIGTTPDGGDALDALTTAVWSCGDNLANT